MAEIVNLNRVRKKVSREKAAEAAAANRVRHGRTRVERARDRLEAERTERALQAAELDGAGENSSRSE